MVYYNQDQNLLYILAGGKFYKIDLTKDEQTVLAKNLEEGQYTVSADGHLIAYQTSGTINTAQEIKVLNLKTDEENAVDRKIRGSNQTALDLSDQILCMDICGRKMSVIRQREGNCSRCMSWRSEIQK